MADALPCLFPLEPVWHHERLRWWAVGLRACGYARPLPAWARVRCTATWPMTRCPCGMYRINVAHATWEGNDDV
jgi:hypothetical protein